MGTQAWLADNLVLILGIMAMLILILLIMCIMMYSSLSGLKTRYRQMMGGMEGSDLERMLIGHIEETKRVAEVNERLDKELKRQNDVLLTAITKVGTVRFCAFDDVGGDTSFAVALLNAEDSGVVFSSIFGRDDSRTYAKPIMRGNSDYPLTDEETQAIKKAMGKL